MDTLHFIIMVAVVGGIGALIRKVWDSAVNAVDHARADYKNAVDGAKETSLSDVYGADAKKEAREESYE